MNLKFEQPNLGLADEAEKLRDKDNKYVDSLQELAKQENQFREAIFGDDLSKERLDLIADLFSTETMNKMKAEQDKYVDVLTGINNRLAFEQIIPKMIDLHFRENNFFSLLMLDLDHFKKVNDEYGHSIGDFVLKQITQIISQELRNSDFIFRYGGEEFVIFLPKTDSQAAKLVAEKIRRAVEQSALSTNQDGQEISLHKTVSIGCIGSDSLDLKKLTEEKAVKEEKKGSVMNTALELADTALYWVKYKGGRNKVLDYKAYLEMPKEL